MLYPLLDRLSCLTARGAMLLAIALLAAHCASPAAAPPSPPSSLPQPADTLTVPPSPSPLPSPSPSPSPSPLPSPSPVPSPAPSPSPAASPTLPPIPTPLPFPDAAPYPVNAAVRTALLEMWQCDRARRGLPLLIIDPALEQATHEVWRDRRARGLAALDDAGARFYMVRSGALFSDEVATLRCDAVADALLPAQPPPPEVTRIGLLVMGPDPTAPDVYQFIHVLLIGVREGQP